MPSLGVNDIVEVTIEGKLDKQQTVSTFHYRVYAVSGAFDMFDELGAILTKLREAGGLFGTYQGVTSDALVDLQMYAQVIYPIRYRYTDNGVDTQSGGVDALSFPANVQASITRAAERAGRRYVSHLAVPAVPITAIENSELVAAYKSDLGDLAFQILQGLVTPNGAELYPVIFNKDFDPVYQQLKFAFVQNTSRVIRRRTVGLGS